MTPELLQSTLEVSSDVLGAVSGLVLLLPAWRVVSAHQQASRLENKIRQAARVQGREATEHELAPAKLAKDRAGNIDPLDGKLLVAGFLTFFGSYLLKLLFHSLTKRWWDWSPVFALIA